MDNTKRERTFLQLKGLFIKNEYNYCPYVFLSNGEREIDFEFVVFVPKNNIIHKIYILITENKLTDKYIKDIGEIVLKDNAHLLVILAGDIISIEKLWVEKIYPNLYPIEYIYPLDYLTWNKQLLIQQRRR